MLPPLHKLPISSLTVLTFVGVFGAAMAYFVEGRMKVTYRVAMVLVALLLSLFLVRIPAIRFSPNRRKLCEGL